MHGLSIMGLGRSGGISEDDLRESGTRHTQSWIWPWTDSLRWNRSGGQCRLRDRVIRRRGAMRRN
jgi:hypothetical protein